MKHGLQMPGRVGTYWVMLVMLVLAAPPLAGYRVDRPDYGWLFNDGSGSTVDSFFGTADGSWNAGAGWTTNSAFGGSGNGAASFSGSSSAYIDFNAIDTVLNGEDAFTFSFWVYATTGSVEDRSFWTGQNNIGSDNDSYGTRFDDSGFLGSADNPMKFAFTVDGTNYNWETEANSALTGQWQHVVVTWDGNGGGFTTYIDNDNQTFTGTNATLPTSGTISDMTQFILGGGPKATWQGYIDEVSLWVGDTFTADEVSWLNSNSLTNIARWDNGGSGTAWGTAGNWVGDVVPGTSAFVYFSDDAGSGAKSLSLGANRSAAAVIFDHTAGYTLNGNTLTLDIPSGSTGIYVTDEAGTPGSPITHTINSNVSLQDAAVFENTVGNATLSLTGALNGNGNSLTVDGGGNTQVSGNISNLSGLTKNGSATLTLSGANTYTGTTTVNAGTLAVTGGSAIADTGLVTTAGGTFAVNGSERIGRLTGSTGNTTLASGQTLTLGDATTFGYAAGISGAGGLTKQGSGTFNLSGTNTYTGTTTVNAGTLAVTGGSAIADTGLVTTAGGTFAVNGSETIGRLTGSTGNTTLASGQTLTLGDATTFGYAAGISGAGGLTKQGSGTFNLSGTNTYTGTTTVNVGTLAISGGSAIADAGTVAVNGGTFAVDASETLAGLTGSGGSVSIATGQTLTLGGGGSTSTAAGLTGAGDLAHSGAGTQTLTGSSGSYTGNLSVTGGALDLAGNTAATSLTLNGGDSTATAQLDLTGALTVTDGTLTLNRTGGNTIANTSGISVGSNGNLTLAADDQIDGNHSLTLNGGTLTANATDAIDGLTLGAAGSTLDYAGGIGVLSFESISLAGYDLSVDDWDNTTFGGSGGDRLLVNFDPSSIASDITFTTQGQTADFRLLNSGAFAGYYELFPEITGTEWVGGDGSGPTNWTLDANWDTTGNDPNAVGAVALFADQGTSYPNVTLNDNRTAGQVIFDQAIDYTVSGANTLTLDNGGDGAIISATGGGDHTFASSIDLNDDATFQALGGTGSLTLSGAISGAGGDSVEITGDGRVILSGNSSYAGATTVTGGATLELGDNDALGNQTNGTTIDPGGTLALGALGGTLAETITFADGASTGTLENRAGNDNTVSGGLVFNNTTTDSTVFVDDDGAGNTDTLTVTGTLTGSGALDKTGDGTLILNNDDNTFSGGTTISGGRVSIGTESSKIADSIVFGQIDAGGNYLGSGDITVADGGEFYVYSDINAVPVEFFGTTTIETGGKAVIQTFNGKTNNNNQNAIQFNDQFTVEEDAELFMRTHGDSDIRIFDTAAFDSLGEICMISGDDFQFDGEININGGSLNFVTFDDFETSPATDGATMRVTGGASINVITAYDYENRTFTGDTNSTFVLQDDDFIKVEDTGSVFSVFADGPVELRGTINWKGGNTFQVLRSSETTLYNTTVLDGGTAAEKGTFILTGILDINASPAQVLNNPNVTITTDQYGISVGANQMDCNFAAVQTGSADNSVTGQALTGLGTFTKTGTGTTDLELTNLGAQEIAVEEGILTTDADNLIQAGADLTVGTSTTSGTLDIRNDDHSFDDLTIEDGSVWTGNGTLTLTGDQINQGADGSGFIGQDSSGTGLADVVLAAPTVTADIGDGSDAVDLEIDGNVTGASTSLVKEGDGVLQINGSTWGGDTTVNAGELDVQNLADSGAVALNGGTLTINNDDTIGSLAGTPGGTLAMGTNDLTTGGNNDTTTFGGSITGSGDVTKDGTGTLTLTGDNTTTGNVTVSDGSLALANSTGQSLSGTGQITVENGSQLVISPTTATGGQVNTGTDLVLSGGDLVMDAPGGDIDEEFNNLNLTADSGITFDGNSAVLTFNGVDLDFDNDGTDSLLTISEWDGLASGGGGAHQFIIPYSLVDGMGGDDLDTSKIDFAGFDTGFEFVDLGNGFAEILPSFDAETFIWDADTSAFWDGTTDSNWQLDDGSNPTRSPEAGDLVVFNNIGSADNVVSVSADSGLGYMEFSGGTDYTLNNSGGTRTFTFDTTDGNTARITTADTGAHTINPDIVNGDSDGLIVGQGSSGLLTLAGDITNNNPLTVRGNGDTTVSGVVTGTGSLTKSGSGTLNMTGTANSGFSGDVTIRGGTVNISGSDSLGSTPNAVDLGGAGSAANVRLLATEGGNGTDLALDLDVLASPTTITVGGSHGSGTSTYSGDINLGENLFITAATGGTVDFSGAISGSGGLDKIDGGTAVLSGTGNTFTGDSTLQAGTLRADATGALGNLGGNAWTQSTGTTLDLNMAGGTTPALTSGDWTVNGGVGGATLERTIASGSDSTLMGDGGTLTLNGNVALDSTDGTGGAFVTGGSTVLSADSYATVDTGANGIFAFNDTTAGSLDIGTGATLELTGTGRVDFGSSAALDIIGNGTGTATESTLILGDGVDLTNLNAGTGLTVNGAKCWGLEIQGSASQINDLLQTGTANSMLVGLSGSGGTLTLNTTTNGLTVDEGPSTSSNVNLGIAANSGSDITTTLDNSGSDLNTYAGLVMKGNEGAGDLRVELTGGNLDLDSQTDSILFIKEGTLDTNGNNVEVDGDATLQDAAIEGGGTIRASNEILIDPTSGSFTVSVGATLDADGGRGLVLEGGTLLLDGGSIANDTDINLAGGDWETGTFTQSGADVLGTLTLSAASELDLSGTDTIMTFANSREIEWVGGSQFWEITDWNGSLDGGGNDQIIFEDATGGFNGLTNTQLAQIRFVNPVGFTQGSYGARILPSGEIVPVGVVVPEPSTYAAGGLLSLLGLWHFWRRRKARAAGTDESPAATAPGRA
ncbi:MAG: beta strand repeat-containing protein [Opitutales bacterium]